MNRKIVKTALIVLAAAAIVIIAGGALLSMLGVEVFCLGSENGRMALEPCGGEAPLTADTNPPQIAAGAQPILIDTDMAVDDWLAILYLLQRPDVDVRAITVAGTGEAHCGPGVKNALDLVALAGRPEIPVACGHETPLQGNHVFPQSWRDNVDRLAGLSIPANPTQPQGEDAAALITGAVRDAGGDLLIITLGPLTNLAQAFAEDPAVAREVKEIFVMGGAMSVPGNVGMVPETGIENDRAEWNIYVDPYAASQVLASGAPVTLVPLDATNQVVLDKAFYDRLEGDRASPEAEFVYRALTQNIGFVNSGLYYFWDPLTAAIAVDQGLGSFASQPVLVIEEEGPEVGAVRADESGSLVRITVAAEEERFKQEFLDVLNGRVME
ncbi:MAG: nucleoside hydrolase [Candidatus Promineifilaceae bacterium]